MNGLITPLATKDDYLGNLLAAPAPLGLDSVIRFDHATQRWHIWNGIRWRPDNTRAVYDLIRQQSAAWWAAADEDVTPDSTGDEVHKMCALMTDAGWFKVGRGDLRKMILPLGDTGKKDSVLKGLSGRAGIAMEGHEWNRHPWQLGCANGIVDLRDGGFARKGDPKDLVTLSTNVEYDPDAPSPTVFLQNLAEITAKSDGTPDPETAKHMLILLGYALWGDKDEEVFTQWPGTGRNGKGKLKDILLCVLGDYAGSLVPGFYTKPKWGAPESSAPRPDLLDVIGKRIMFESEPEGGDLNIERVKKHAGRDQERGRQLHSGAYITFVPSHLIVLLTNNVLKVDKVDPALEDRLLVYPFERRFDVDTTPPADPGRLDEMKAEAPGILALLVRACAAWHTESTSGTRHKVLRAAMTERMKLATGKYLAANDPLRSAIEAYFVRDQGAWESAQSLYATYCEWHAATVKEDPEVAGAFLTRAHFTGGLRNGLGLGESRHDHNTVRGFLGLRSKPFADRPVTE
jgi:putative DNA primase/helicase